MFKFFVENLVDNFKDRWKTKGGVGDGSEEKTGCFVEKRNPRPIRWKSPEFYTKTEHGYQPFF